MVTAALFPAQMDRLKKAEKTLSQANKKKGKAAAELYEKAVVRFERAIVRGLEASKLQKAHIKKGNCFCRWAQSVVSDVNAIAYGKLDRKMHEKGMNRAKALLQAAVQSYKQTGDGIHEWNLPHAASANCGHALSLWAELCEAGEKISLLQSATKCYQNTLKVHPEDTEIQMDLADVLIHLAEALSESNHREDSLWTFQEAMRIFEETHTQMVAKAHSIKRRDMAELNLRCGIGHITAAEHALEREGKVMHCTEAVQLLQKAVELKPSSEALNALGDALEASAEVCEGREAKVFLTRALQEGYGAAKSMNKTDIDAILGVAKVSFLLAKLELRDGAHPAQFLSKSMRQYEKALHSPLLNGFQERSEAMYNYSCCCALAGREDVVKACLAELLHKGGTTTLEISTDKDFRSVKEAEWFQCLMSLYEVEDYSMERT